MFRYGICFLNYFTVKLSETMRMFTDHLLFLPFVIMMCISCQCCLLRVSVASQYICRYGIIPQRRLIQLFNSMLFVESNTKSQHKLNQNHVKFASDFIYFSHSFKKYVRQRSLVSYLVNSNCFNCKKRYIFCLIYEK